MRYTDFAPAPLQVRSNEELDFFAAQNSGGAVYFNAIVMFTDGPIRPASSTGYVTVHATASTTRYRSRLDCSHVCSGYKLRSGHVLDHRDAGLFSDRYRCSLHT